MDWIDLAGRPAEVIMNRVAFFLALASLGLSVAVLLSSHRTPAIEWGREIVGPNGFR